MRNKLTMLLVVSINLFFAQESNLNFTKDSSANNTASKEKPNTYKVSLQAGNNLSQNGKKMAKDEYYLRPSFNYYHIKGAYATTYIVYLPFDKKRPIDNIYLNAGYDKEFGSNLTIGLDYAYIYYYSSKQVSSSASNYITLNSSWYNKKITPTLSAILSAGSTVDYTGCLDLSHSFSWKNIFKKEDKLTLPIAIGIYAGTSNSYKNYSVSNKVTDKAGKSINANLINTGLAITSIYFSSTCKYRFNEWSLATTINYYLQFNQPKKLASSNLPVFRITLSRYFD